MRASVVTVAMGLFLVGCAQVPKPSTYLLSYQQKMQAAHHWELLAQDVAGRVVAEQGTLGTGGVYVQPTAGVFGEAFANLVKTELVRNGVAVTSAPANAAVLAVDVQLIRHRAKWPHRANRMHPGFWTGVATIVRLADNVTKNMIIPAGVAADMLDGSMTTLTEHEVVITTSLDKDGRCLMRQSDIYYVNDADRMQYAKGTPAKTLEVVAK